MKANKIKYPQYETYIELCKTKTEFVQLNGYENVREWRITHKFTQK